MYQCTALIYAIYSELDIMPNIRFFGTLYIDRNILSEPYNEILRSIEKKENAWIVLSFTPLMKESGFSNEVRDAIKNDYELVIDDVFLDNEIYHRID